MKRDIEMLKDKARAIRQDIITMLTESASGHPGGSLSATEILTSLYFSEMRVDPKNPHDAERDRFVLSKGHACPVLYATLAEKGFFDKKELMTLRKIDSNLQGHPNMNETPGIDMSTGSLGQGLSAANGMALAARLDKKDYRVYVLLGDGELEEGQVWEAAMSSAHYKLDNLVAFVDNNHLQIDGPVSSVMNPEPVADKFRAFGWHVISINGHSFEEIFAALDESKTVKGKPVMIVANTIKGKGVSFMENQAGWHGTAPSKDQCRDALCEIGGVING